jgi:hypothetical protein
MRKITLEYSLVMTTLQRNASSLRLKTQIRTLASWTFYYEMDATADRRVDLGGYGFLDLRSSPLRREDVRSVRHVFKQRVGLLGYAFAIKKHNLFAVLIEYV